MLLGEDARSRSTSPSRRACSLPSGSRDCWRRPLSAARPRATGTSGSGRRRRSGSPTPGTCPGAASRIPSARRAVLGHDDVLDFVRASSVAGSRCALVARAHHRDHLVAGRDGAFGRVDQRRDADAAADEQQVRRRRPGGGTRCRAGRRCARLSPRGCSLSQPRPSADDGVAGWRSGRRRRGSS